MIDFTQQRQSLHDKIAGTLVVYSKKSFNSEIKYSFYNYLWYYKIKILSKIGKCYIIRVLFTMYLKIF